MSLRNGANRTNYQGDHHSRRQAFSGNIPNDQQQASIVGRQNLRKSPPTCCAGR